MKIKALIAGSVLLLIVGAQCYFYSQRVPIIDAGRYSGSATHLRSTPDWHFGYLSDHHGALLVKTPSAEKGALPSVVDDSEIHGLMADQLEAIPFRTIQEVGFYFAILVWVFFIIPSVAHRIGHRLNNILFRSLSIGFAAVATYLLIIFPYLALDYGGSAFTNWVGPGAYSYTSFGAGKVTLQSGLTISYRPMLEFALSLPVWTLKPCSWVVIESDTLELLFMGLSFPSEYLTFFFKQIIVYFALGTLVAFLTQMIGAHVSQSPITVE